MAEAALPRSAAGSYSPWLLAVVISIATFMEVLDTTIVNVSLRNMAGSLSAGQDESTYIVTSYLVSNAMVLPVSGYLSNIIGRKRFYMGCVVLFTVASVFCAFSTSLWGMLFWRVIQGIGGGGLAPVEQSMFADSFPPEKLAAAFSIYGVTVVSAPALGPVLGGWLTDNYSWRWVFLINVPFGLLSLAATWFVVHDSDAVRQERRKLLQKGIRLDWLGIALVAIGFGTLQICLDRYERADGIGSLLINVCGSICVVSLVALVIWEWYHPNPAMDVRLFRIPTVALSDTVMFAFGFTIYSTTQLLPQLAQTLLGYNATEAGLTLGVAGLVSIVMMPVAGLVTGRLVQPKWLIFMALCGTGYSMLSAAGIDLTIGFNGISLARVLQVAWLPFLFVPLEAVSYIGVPPAKNPDASALQNMMRNLGGSVGVAYTTTLLAYRTQFHHARLAEHVTPYHVQAAGQSVPALQIAVQAQAQILSYLDLFFALAVVAFVVAPLALFLPRLRKAEAG